MSKLYQWLSERVANNSWKKSERISAQWELKQKSQHIYCTWLVTSLLVALLCTVYIVWVLQQSSAGLLTVTISLQYSHLFLFRLVTIMISSQGITAGIPHHMHGPCTAMCARMHFQVHSVLWGTRMSFESRLHFGAMYSLGWVHTYVAVINFKIWHLEW